MRSRVTIDEDLLAEVELLAARTHRTVDTVLDDAIRVALRHEGTQAVGRVLVDGAYATKLRADDNLPPYDMC